MLIKDAIELINSIQIGKDFMVKYPDNDIIIKSDIGINDINRIMREYPDLLPISSEEFKNNQDLSIHSITIIAKKMTPLGYPKLRIYFRKINDKFNPIRVLISE